MILGLQVRVKFKEKKIKSYKICGQVLQVRLSLLLMRGDNQVKILSNLKIKIWVKNNQKLR
jgi:hypothetical protein